MKISYSPIYQGETYYIGLRRKYFSLSEVLAAAIISMDVGSHYNIEFIRNDNVTSIPHPLFERIEYKDPKTFTLYSGCSISAWKKHSFNILEAVFMKHLGLTSIPSSYEKVHDNFLSYLEKIELDFSKQELVPWTPSLGSSIDASLPASLEDFRWVFKLTEKVYSAHDFDRQNEVFTTALKQMQDFLWKKLLSMVEKSLVA